MSLFPQPIIYRRTTGALNSIGIWEDSGVVEGTILGSIQPASGDELEALPENERKTGLYKVYINFTDELIAPTEGGTNKGDILEWQGGLYQVIKEGKYNNNLIPHRKYFAQYIGESN